MGASGVFTVESWISFVNFHMFIVICSLSERLTAALNVTKEWSLSSVDSNVISEVMCLLKISNVGIYSISAI